MDPAELMRVGARRSTRSARATSCTTARRTSFARDDPDLALLAGDRLYALGLQKLAAAGDLEAIEVAVRDDRDVCAIARRRRL